MADTDPEQKILFGSMVMRKNRKMVKPSQKALIALFGSVLLFAGCGNLVGPDDSHSPTLSLSVQIPMGTSAVAGTSGAGFILTDGVNELDITSVGIVLREIELERQFELDCDEIEAAGQDDNFCEEFEAGPVLLELALDGSVKHLVTIEIPDGVYDELEFDVHKVKGDMPENRASLLLHPQFDGRSIRVSGTYNGEVFAFDQDLDEEQELNLNPPLVVTGETVAINLTICIDIKTWFRRASGDLLNPESANKGEANEELVEENIKDSIEAFEDDCIFQSNPATHSGFNPATHSGPIRPRNPFSFPPLYKVLSEK